VFYFLREFVLNRKYLNRRHGCRHDAFVGLMKPRNIGRMYLEPQIFNPMAALLVERYVSKNHGRGQDYRGCVVQVITVVSFLGMGC